MSTIEQHAEDWHAMLKEEKLIAELTAGADDRAAQLAMAIESIADEIDQLHRHVAELRTDVAQQRGVLDELRALVRHGQPSVARGQSSQRLPVTGMGLVLGCALGATVGLILVGLTGLLVAGGVGATLGLLVGVIVDAAVAPRG